MAATVCTRSGHPISSLKLPPVAFSAACHQLGPGGAIGRTVAATISPPIVRAIQTLIRIARARDEGSQPAQRSH
jgi:hypothetical protein